MDVEADIANQDVKAAADCKTCLTYKLIGLFCSLHTVPKRVRYSRGRIAVPGREPAIKCTSDGGELTESFRMFCKVLLNCWSIHDISVSDRRRLANPDISTDVPYMERILREAAGFDLLPLARPQETTAQVLS